MIKRLILFAIIISVGVISLFLLRQKHTSSEVFIRTQQVARIAIGIPQQIEISSIHVVAPVESVGLTPANLMDVPKNAQDTAWYNLGPKPGEEGNAVIDGHVDTPTGAPAVFAQLREVQKGDVVIIHDNQGKKYTFRVDSVASLPSDPFPVQEVFGKNAGSHLNLITCDGVWDPIAKNYSKRFVVFSHLEK